MCRNNIFLKCLKYKSTACHRKGFGIHSPFVFDFIRNILRNKGENEIFRKIEGIRKELQHDHSRIQIEDFGAGSRKFQHSSREINRIVRYSAIRPKYGRMLFNLVRYFEPETILELGTSTGISTMYLASARSGANVITLEADSSLADLAQNNFKRLGLNNIRLIRGRFDDNLPLLLKEISKFDLVFIDGNHRKEPVLNYFRLISANMDSSGILVLDDIHWSAEMEEAWDILKKEERVSLSIDLFFTGILFFKNGFQKENFVLNF